jgi:hypothetical protein
VAGLRYRTHPTDASSKHETAKGSERARGALTDRFSDLAVVSCSSTASVKTYLQSARGLRLVAYVVEELAALAKTWLLAINCSSSSSHDGIRHSVLSCAAWSLPDVAFRAGPSCPWLSVRGFRIAPRGASESSPHEPMAAQHEARRVQPGLPAVFRPDRRRVVEQTVFFLLLAQPGELGVKGMIGPKERLLAMQDRWMAVAIWSRQWMWRVRSEIEIRMAGVRCPTGHARQTYCGGRL